MKIDEHSLSNLQKTLKADYEKAKEKGNLSTSKDPKSLVNESNQEAYQVSLTMVDKASPSLQIHQADEAQRMAETLKNMVLPNPREAGNAHVQLDANRVRSLLSD